MKLSPLAEAYRNGHLEFSIVVVMIIHHGHILPIPALLDLVTDTEEMIRGGHYSPGADCDPGTSLLSSSYL